MCFQGVADASVFGVKGRSRTGAPDTPPPTRMNILGFVFVNVDRITWVTGGYVPNNNNLPEISKF